MNTFFSALVYSRSRANNIVNNANVNLRVGTIGLLAGAIASLLSALSSNTPMHLAADMSNLLDLVTNRVRRNAIIQFARLFGDKLQFDKPEVPRSIQLQGSALGYLNLCRLYKY